MKKPVIEVYNHWLPPMLGAEAMVIGNTIYYKGAKTAFYPPKWLVRHEMVHVKQYEKYGLFGFLVLYLFWYLLGRMKGKDHWTAYKDIPFEVEARKAEREV